LETVLNRRYHNTERNETAMRSLVSLKPNRSVAGILAIMMLSVLLFSSIYIAHEAEHDCSGDDCPICACIRQCENVLRGTGKTYAVSTSLLPLFIVFSAFVFTVCLLVLDTPVSKKIRLNN